MHSRTIIYKNFDEEEVSSVHYFHFGIPELIELELTEEGGLSKLIKRLVEERDGGAIISMVQRFVLDSYGVKSNDGETFEKNEDVRRKFSQSAAYEQLFTDLATNAEMCGEFINAIMPAEMIKQAEERVAQQAAVAKAAVPGSVESTITAMGGTPDTPAPWNPLAAQAPSPPPATQGLGVIVPQTPPAPQR